MSNLLANYTTCEISDALIKLGLPHGGHIPDILPLSPVPSTRICGPAYTVQMELFSHTSSPKLSSHFIDTAPEGCVIVIDAPRQVKSAAWGGLMTAGAIVRGARGVIISGRCRDMSEHHACSFPVFARGRSTLGQTPFTRPTAVNVPLEIKTGFEGLAGAEGDGGFPPCVWVQPGDWMVADEDGVVCVPTSLVEQVLDLAREGREVDTRCLVDIKNGTGVQESFRWHRGK